MAKRRDFGDITGTETLIGAGVKLKGNLSSDGDISVDGSMTGNIKAGGNVTLGPNAIVQGDIACVNVRISGHLTGHITASGETSIASSGRVTGDIKTNDINIESGAIFLGSIEMTSHEPSPEPTPISPKDTISPEKPKSSPRLRL